ncbi:CAP domain-containing protein [Arthrobacter sp. LAPM80]|uniref:CAP domain-containing protein n=1 Tax=Arthrobacter sp. LAPM80 TaxID=3141788 RepID=UPI00398BB820
MLGPPATGEAIPDPAASNGQLAVPFAVAVSDPYLAQVLDLANKVRASNGAGPLALSATIATGSQQWAAILNTRINNDTVDMNKLHRTDAGLSILPSGADMYSEIIGINTTPAQIIDWWMNSPAHRAALLDKRATTVGMGQVTTTKAGWYGMKVVVANLAGYPGARPGQPQPAPVPVAKNGDVAAVDPAGSLFVYDSARGGDLWQRRYISGGWAGAQQFDVVDFNADGNQDIVAVWADGRLTVSYGQSDGTLSAPVTIGTSWGPYEIAVTKWSSSTKFPGVVAKDSLTGELFYYPAVTGSGLGARTRIGTSWGPMTFVSVDVNGDGLIDIAARDAAGDFYLYPGIGNGAVSLGPRTRIGTSWDSMSHISGIENHLGNNAGGILARDKAGNLFHYPVVNGGIGARKQIGSGGWQTLRLGS